MLTDEKNHCEKNFKSFFFSGGGGCILYIHHNEFVDVTGALTTEV